MLEFSFFCFFFFPPSHGPGGRPTFSGWIRGVAFGVVDTRALGRRVALVCCCLGGRRGSSLRDVCLCRVNKQVEQPGLGQRHLPFGLGLSVVCSTAIVLAHDMMVAFSCMYFVPSTFAVRHGLRRVGSPRLNYVSSHLSVYPRAITLIS
ncbi:hypothetical protein LZ31DRAFT_187075 [Colletotrichum somersetense]|nr:hypothetical protein LZ31DRAFT_187075 [Colletotrichum somersetense]